MKIINEILELKTEAGINIDNLTPKIQAVLDSSAIQRGHVMIFCRHTTTAIAINENEIRLFEDIKAHLNFLAPQDKNYLHNDLHLRDVPPDEPENAHSHLMAMMLNNSEFVPILNGKLGLGTWQSILFVELDGPRDRTVLVQICGE